MGGRNMGRVKGNKIRTGQQTIHGRGFRAAGTDISRRKRRIMSQDFHADGPSDAGHPLADLAYQCMQWRLPHSGGFRGLGGVVRSAIGLPSEAEYVRDYCLRRNIAEIPHWHSYLAFSFFRLAAILQGVYKRSLDGNASNPERARNYGAAVPILAQMAMQMIDEEA